MLFADNGTNQVNEALPEHCFWIAEDQLDTIPIVGAHRKWLNVGLAEEAGSTPEKAEPASLKPHGGRHRRKETSAALGGRAVSACRKTETGLLPV